MVNPGETEINMVFFSFPPARDPRIAERIVETFAQRQILINAPEKGLFRFVTHYWIGEEELEAILAASREAFQK
jgi:threonine aldolase